jgi:hypothetical protein
MLSREVRYFLFALIFLFCCLFLFLLIYFAAYAEEEQSREKKIESMQAKLQLETKLKEDMQQLKARLEVSQTIKGERERREDVEEYSNLQK